MLKIALAVAHGFKRMRDRTGQGRRTLHDTAAAASSSTTTRPAVCCTLVLLAALNISRRLHSRVELNPGPFSG